MSMLNHRLQILIDEDRFCRLRGEAERRHVSVATLVREAIDQRYPADADRRRAGLQALLAAPAMQVPDAAELRHELAEVRDRRRA